ncbi:contact-dependent growth inhibition system immunity protein [Streptomyces stramineus]
MPDEFADHDAALADYAESTDPSLVARVAGEVTELLALPLDETDYALALVELGMEVEPPAPYSPSGWLALIGGRFGERRPEYGPPRT